MISLRTTRSGKPVDYALTNGGVILGSSPGCQIVVADPGAAPKHAKVAKSPKGYVVSDLTGGGGTVVNGAKVKDHVLKHGDVIQIGAEKFVFTDKSAAPAPAAKPAAAPAASAKQPAALQTAGARSPRPSAPAVSPAKSTVDTSKFHTPVNAPTHPRKMTKHPPLRIHKERASSMPATARGKTIAILVSVGLAVVGGILYMISSKTVNSEQVKTLAKTDIEALEKIPENDILKRYDKAVEILGNADYDRYAKGEIQPAVRVRNDLQGRVDLEKRAGPVLKPFFERYRALKEGPPEEYKKQAESMYEIVKVHYDNFGTTSYEAELAEIRKELKEILENVGPSWSQLMPQLVRDVQKQIEAGNFANGLALITEFGSKHGAKDSPSLRTQLQTETENLRAKAKAHIERAKVTADAMTGREEGRKSLESQRPFIKGFPDVEKLLEKYIREHK